MHHFTKDLHQTRLVWLRVPKQMNFWQMAHIAGLMKGEDGEGPVPTATQGAYVLNAVTAAGTGQVGSALRGIGKSLDQMVQHMSSSAGRSSDATQ